MNAKTKAIKGKITMSRKEFIDEHKKLVKSLKTGKGIKKEYREQKKELDETTK